MTRYKWLIAVGMALAVLVTSAMTRAAPDPEVTQMLKEMYALRARALVTGQSPEGMDRFYDLSTQGGRFALAHEAGRITYMQAWAPARRLAVTEAATAVTNLRVNVQGDAATVSLISRTRLGYKYDGSSALNEMGIGSWHYLELVRRDGRWQVKREFYLDALGDEWTAPFVPSGAELELPPSAVVAAGAQRGRLNRQGAVEYAEQFCGAAWGCGNNSDYNQRYRSYRNLGGDCANFASQVLTEGGGLKADWIWRPGKVREGSACWVNAQSFARYLSGSGRAAVLARGTYSQVEPALKRLKPGDIIAYQRNGTIGHVSVVTGTDSAGVPVVAAHTADRYRNPWDLGWSKDTVFWLLHLHD